MIKHSIPAFATRVIKNRINARTIKHFNEYGYLKAFIRRNDISKEFEKFLELSIPYNCYTITSDSRKIYITVAVTPLYIIVELVRKPEQ